MKSFFPLSTQQAFLEAADGRIRKLVQSQERKKSACDQACKMCAFCMHTLALRLINLYPEIPFLSNLQALSGDLVYTHKHNAELLICQFRAKVK